MFCCLDYGNTGSYPGNRGGYGSTGGNALSMPQDYRMNTNETVLVTVPPNRKGGDEIIVSAPSGKCIRAIIPQNMRCGDQFQVDIPNDPYNNTIGNEKQVQTHLTNEPYKHQPSQAITPIPLPPPSAPEKDAGTVPIAQAVAIPEPEPQQSAPPVVDAFNPAPPQAPVPVVDPSKQLMLVKVPPGCAPGTILHVQIPGENRMVGAQVPPNVREFHVAYEPQSRSQLQQPQFQQVVGQRVAAPRQSHGGRDNYNRYDNNTYSSVDDDRYGYQGYSNNGYSNGYHQNQNQNQNQTQTQQYNSNRHNGFSNDLRSGQTRTQGNRSGGGMGILAPILGGAAMLGAAGYMIGHHDHGVDYGGDGSYGDGGDYGDDGGDD